jgi:hypothetical protein
VILFGGLKMNCLRSSDGFPNKKGATLFRGVRRKTVLYSSEKYDLVCILSLVQCFLL